VRYSFYSCREQHTLGDEVIGKFTPGKALKDLKAKAPAKKK